MAGKLHGFAAGNLARDCESSFTNNGEEMVKISFPVEEYAPRGQQKVTHWIRATLSAVRGAGLKPYLLKGQTVSISGEMKVSTYISAQTGKPMISIDFYNPSLDLIGGSPQQADDQVQQAAPAQQRNGATFGQQAAPAQKTFAQARAASPQRTAGRAAQPNIEEAEEEDIEF